MTANATAARNTSAALLILMLITLTLTVAAVVTVSHNTHSGHGVISVQAGGRCRGCT